MRMVDDLVMHLIKSRHFQRSTHRWQTMVNSLCSFYYIFFPMCRLCVCASQRLMTKKSQSRRVISPRGERNDLWTEPFRVLIAKIFCDYSRSAAVIIVDYWIDLQQSRYSTCILTEIKAVREVARKCEGLAKLLHSWNTLNSQLHRRFFDQIKWWKPINVHFSCKGKPTEPLSERNVTNAWFVWICCTEWELATVTICFWLILLIVVAALMKLHASKKWIYRSVESFIFKFDQGIGIELVNIQ